MGLDTESNGFHAYTERLCLLQVATRDADWVIDPLAVKLDPLVPLLSDPAREVILHAAEFDVLMLKKEAALTLGRIFDTHAAAKALGVVRVGLGNLVKDELGIDLTEDEQRSDWGRRPLSPSQLSYAFADVRFLLPLRDRLSARLVEKGLVREAEAEFERLRAKEPKPRVFDPEGWQKMKAARTLDTPGRAILRELFQLRDRRARELDRPPFKVLSDLFLAEVAARKPREAGTLAGIPGASSRQLEKLTAQILEAVQSGLAAPPVARPKPPAGRRFGKAGPPPPEVEERYERLRDWRKARAATRQVEVQVIAPNAVLMAAARSDPRTLAELAKVEGMDPFRLEQYGAEMLAALAAPPGKPAAPVQGKLIE